MENTKSLISLFTLVDENSVFYKIWNIVSSTIAIYIYVALLLVLVIILVVLMLVNESKRQDVFVINNRHERIKEVSVVNGNTNTNNKKNKKKLNERQQFNNDIDFENIGDKTIKFEAQTTPGLDKKLDDKTEEKLESSRFYNLSKLDVVYKEYNKPSYDDTISLSQLCEDFRKYSCNKLGLFYDIKDIRRFIAGLSVTHTLILQGMSGTGKTSLAYAFGRFLQNDTTIVPIQPMWKERTDLIGYYNEFTKKFNETTLLSKLYEANLNDEIYITVLDEMNIARVEYYFAEFLSLLEIPDVSKRNLDVVNDEWKNDPKLLKNGQLKLPQNMWFIGTANNDDSTFAISDKVYDRAMVINLDKKANSFECEYNNNYKLSFTHFNDLILESRKEYKMSNRNYKRLKTLDKYLIDHFHITFGNRIMKQIKDYIPVVVSCGGNEVEAIDDIVSKKILRKLEAKNPVYVKNESKALISFMNELFGENSLSQSIEYILTIEMN